MVFLHWLRTSSLRVVRENGWRNSWGRANAANVVAAARLRRSRGVINPPVRRIWGNGRCNSKCDALGFAEQRDENEQGKDCGLNENGEEQRAAANVAFAMALLRVTFDK